MMLQDLICDHMKIKRFYYCPSCIKELSSEVMNIKEGVALCPNCNQLSKLSEVIIRSRPTQEILTKPPSGCFMNNENNQTTIIVSLRSISGMIFTGFFALFWNGSLSIFLSAAVAALYVNFIGPLPAWFPFPEINKGNNDLNTPGGALFLCLFLTPFLLTGAGVTILFLLLSFGKITIKMEDETGIIRTGLRYIYWPQRFNPKSIYKIDSAIFGHSSNGSCEMIKMMGEKTTNFGYNLQSDRVEWLTAILQELLIKKTPVEKIYPINTAD